MKVKVYIQNLLRKDSSYYRFISGIIEDDLNYYIWDFEARDPKHYCVLDKDCYKIWFVI